jgi:lipoprotein-anchoring transpeptidase ErfK/SrfK
MTLHVGRPTRRAAALLGGVVMVVAVVSACSATKSGTGQTSTSAGSSTTGSSSSSTSSSGTPAPSSSTVSASASAAGTPVHIQLKFSDGSQFGVGIPVIAFFSRNITNAKALQAATTLKINGKPVTGGRWYFESSDADPGYPLEGDYRLQNYWPAHSSIFVNMPVKGLAAGNGLVYNDSLTSSFTIGASHIATVDNYTHKLTLVSDGKVEGVYPVSLGATDTPTARGTKVIMEKGASICMSGPGYHICDVKYTQRLTYGGEYLHAAPWNVSHIENGINSSNGCTNLLPADAEKLFNILEIGDVVKFPNANGPAMTMGAGYGDWNVPWAQWLTGGDIENI